MSFSRTSPLRGRTSALAVAAVLAFGALAPVVAATPAAAACAQPLQWGGHQNGYVPTSAMTSITWASGHRLQPAAAERFEALNQAYRARFGTNISVTDSYRSYAAQVALKEAKGKWAATPGCSNHGWGRAVDLGGGINRFGTDQYRWMLANASAYGWVAPRWARQDGSLPEPWHWEFPGSGVTSQPDAAPETPTYAARISALTSSSSLAVKEGPVNAVWLTVLDGMELATTVTTPTRIAALSTSGELYVKAGAVNAPWALVARDVADFDVTDDRVVVALRSGAAQLKEGPLSAQWVTIVAGGATDVEVAGTRIGALVNGAALVKEGAWDAPWVTLSGSVEELELDGSRVAIRKAGAVHVKEGALNAVWSTVFTGQPVDVELGGNRVAVRTADTLVVKEGSLDAMWVTVATGGITDVAVTQDRVAMVSGGALAVKEGGLGAPWTTVSDKAKAVDLS
ncbi:M15 family metallopeptidase [Cellulomonas flavigena]|nr:M15 family metallopeptidase [Cellulomonas flavigena]